MSAVFDRLKKSKWAYVASGWTTFIENLAKNPDIAEVIKNDRDFFAHNEAVQSAKDVGKLRRAIKAAIGRAGAIAYMEERRRAEKAGAGSWKDKPKDPDQSWSWQDFTSKVIDAGLEIPKGERGMWVLNCTTLKKGERIKLPGTKEEHEVLDVRSGEAKTVGLGWISAKAEVLVWRPGTGFAEKRTDPRLTDTGDESTVRYELKESEDRKGKGEIEMVRQTRSASSSEVGKPASRTSKSHAHETQPEEHPNRWQKNDGEVPFRFGMPVRRGKMFGKVIRAHGAKLRVKLDDEQGTVEWSTEDDTIFWKDPIAVREDEDQDEAPFKKKGKPVPPPEPFEEKEEGEEEIEDPEEEDDPEEEEEEVEADDDDDDEIDPDDLPDDDDDLLEGDGGFEGDHDDEDPDPDPDQDDDDDGDNQGDSRKGNTAGDDKRQYIYSGNDIAELAGVDYQRVIKLKNQGELDGTWLAASNGRIMFTEEAVERVKNTPKKKPGRPAGGGKNRATRQTEERQKRVAVTAGALKNQPGEQKRAEKAAQTPTSATKPAKADPRQQTISEAAPKDISGVDIGDALRGMKGHAHRVDGKVITEIYPSSASGLRTAADIFAETIDELAVQVAQREAEIVQRQKELIELKKAMEALEGVARRNR